LGAMVFLFGVEMCQRGWHRIFGSWFLIGSQIRSFC